MSWRPKQFKIDQQHSLAKGLVFAGLGSSPGAVTMFDASAYRRNGTLTTMDPPTDWVPIPELGRWGMDFDGSNDYVTITGMPGLANWTFAAWVCVPSGAKEHYLWGCGYNSANGGVLVVNKTTNEPPYSIAYWYMDGTAKSVAIGSVNQLPENTLTHLSVTFDGASLRLFINGHNTNTVNASTVPSPPSCAHQLGWASPRNKSGATLAGRVVDPFIYTRVLTPTEIADLANPSNVYLSGLIAGRPRRRYVFLGGGSTTEITGTLAGIEASGLAASVSAGTTINASLVAVELAGLAASVSAGTDVAAGVGAVEASGLDASVSVGQTINAAAAAVEAYGLAADVVVSDAIEAATAAVELSGLAADVSVGTTLTATTGAIEASGLAATVSVSESIEATAANVDVSGLAATVSAGTTITGSLGTLVATALSATVSAAVGIEASTAAMEWTALSASVGTSGTVTRQLFFGIKSGGAL